jgi:Dolichyl-phosphate-mannose-protein mannosyltransferase
MQSHSLANPLNVLLKGIAAQFEVRDTATKRQSWEVPWLLGIMILGAIIRFWGLGSWGLEGDEKTMALPTMHIVQHWTAFFPSGMFYARAIGQLYMMAASVIAFGQSEWAMRVPSVLCGIALIPISYFFGRRFLVPIWNMAFVTIVAFFPSFIADSQEARMYIFLVASLAAYGALIFQWDRTERVGYLIAAVLVMLIGIQFHALAIFGAFLLFFPGLAHADALRLRHGAIAFVIALVGYFVISHWVESFYPPVPKIDLGVVASTNHFVGIQRSLPSRIYMYLGGFLAAALVAVYLARRTFAGKWKLMPALLVFLGLLCQLLFFYHLGLLLMLVGLIIARRQGVRSWPLAIAVGVAAVIAVAQFLSLSAVAPDSMRRTIGAMVGWPSIWPFLRFVDYSPIVVAVVGAGLIRALWLIAERRRIADYWLFFALTVWLPLFAIGLFAWDVQLRYTEFALLPSLLCATAVCQAAASAAVQRSKSYARPSVQVLMALAASALIVNPIRLVRNVNAGYSIHPDHQGAAAYVKSIHPQADDLIVAEDTLEQTYYLGHIDYWLMGKDRAIKFLQYVHGQLRDIYTGTPLIGTGQELMDLINRPDRGAIYVIGSGELQEDGRRWFRGFGIYEMLQAPPFEPVYLGRDGLTQVWKVPAPSRAAVSSPLPDGNR